MKISQREIRAADVCDRVDFLKSVWREHRDDEACRAEESDVWRWTLRAISEGRCPDPVACAREALKTLRLDFRRDGA